MSARYPRKKNELKALQKEQNRIKRQIHAKLINKILDLISDVDLINGITLLELTQKAYSKKNVTHQEKREVYRAIIAIRKETDQLLACKDNKYGWTNNKADIDSYNLNTIENGLQKVKKGIVRLKKNYAINNITEDSLILISQRLHRYNLELSDEGIEDGTQN